MLGLGSCLARYVSRNTPAIHRASNSSEMCHFPWPRTVVSLTFVISIHFAKLEKLKWSEVQEIYQERRSAR
jgi:hypothetical protein